MLSEGTWTQLQRRLAGGARARGAAADAAADASLWLEGYGPKGGVVLLLCAATQAARTRAEIKGLLHKRGGQLGAPNSIAYLFRQAGVIRYGPGTDPERLAQLAYAAGAEEVVAADDGSVEVLTDPVSLHEVSAHLAAKAAHMVHVTIGAPLDERVLWRTHTSVPLTGEAARGMLQLLLELQDRDDVRSVYSNVEIPDQIVAQL